MKYIAINLQLDFDENQILSWKSDSSRTEDSGIE
jgi:hypothetical protein